MVAFAPDLHVDAHSKALAGLKLTLCGGGGIAAVELPRIAREFRRHGATVRFVVTENCLRFIGLESLEWASGHPVTVNPTGMAEHICHDHAVVVVPATADLLAKISHGICCDGPTTLIQSALGGGIPVLLCPTMHESLAASPIVTENRTRLSTMPGIHMLSPRVEEGKEKVPAPEDLVLESSHIINRHLRFATRPQPHILVTLGGTRVPLDSVRYIGNHSTGSLGRELVLNAYRAGLRVTAAQAAVTRPLASRTGLAVHSVPNYGDLATLLKSVMPEDFDGVFHIAAVSDYAPAQAVPGKIDSTADALTLCLERTEKLIGLPNLRNTPFKAGCKLTATGPEEGVAIARKMAQDHALDAVLWNPSSTFHAADHTGILWARNPDGSEQAQEVTGKRNIAAALVSHFLQHHSHAGRPS